MTYKILIVDDDASYRKLLEMRLRSFFPELSCTLCESLTKAREFLDTNPAEIFDLVILDQHLKDGVGVELLKEGRFKDQAVLSVSSDDSPEIPGTSLKAGAHYFLPKIKISEPMFQPLILGLIERNILQRELQELKTQSTVIETVRTLVDTLRHEINNPLGAVLGAAYLLKTSPASNPELNHAATLVESSGKRIKHVLDELGKAIALEAVTKANQKVFHIPGDKPWESKT